MVFGGLSPGKVISGFIGLILIFSIAGIGLPLVATSSDNIAGSGLPLASFFASNGIVLLALMGGLVLAVIGFVGMKKR